MSSSPDHISSTIGFNSEYCKNISNMTTAVFVCQSDLTLGVVLLVNIGELVGGSFIVECGGVCCVVV